MSSILMLAFAKCGCAISVITAPTILLRAGLILSAALAGEAGFASDCIR
jgi:hypothetical protein